MRLFEGVFGRKREKHYHGLKQDDVLRLLDAHGGELKDSYKPPVFFVGTGRCGTHLYYELLNSDGRIKAMHESMLLQNVDSFSTYCLWNQLPVDYSLFFLYRNALINQCTENGQVYVESNVYSSLSVEQLHQRYDAKIVLALRNPIQVVKSIFNKGWYRDLPHHQPRNGALGYQAYGLKDMNHYFGRIVPIQMDEYSRWMGLTRVGKIAWYVNALNIAILKQLEDFPSDSKKTIYIEQLDYEAYSDLHDFVGSEGQSLVESEFEKIIKSRPGNMKRKDYDWSERESSEFMVETVQLREVLDYEPL